MHRGRARHRRAAEPAAAFRLQARRVAAIRTLTVGQRGRFEQVVEPIYAADRYGNTGVEVLATPVLCHWFETSAVVAIHSQLEPAEATVGTQLSIDHLKATPIGMRVTVEAEVVAVEGRRVNFRIEAHDENELIARGTHERYVVNLARFLEGVQAKRASRPGPQSSP